MALLTGAERDITITTVGAAHLALHLGGWALAQAGARLPAHEQPGAPQPALSVYAEMTDALRRELRAVPTSGAVADLIHKLNAYLEDVATVVRQADSGDHAALTGAAASGLESAALAHQALAAIMARLGPPGAGSRGGPGAATDAGRS